MKRKSLIFLAYLCFLVMAVLGSQVLPTAVSPGRAKGVAIVAETCPTFSWTSADWALGYRIAVFEAIGVVPVSYEQMAASGISPVLTRDIEGRGLSWTPSSEEGLRPGTMYVWYVEALNAAEAGVWSSGRMFIVDAGAAGSALENRVTRILREKGIADDVISGVVKEIAAGTEVVKDGESGGAVGAMGDEGAWNTLYGQNAGHSLGIGGVYNTFIGHSAGYSVTSGQNNIFLGQDAGYHTTTASDNTFLGYEAGHVNSTGMNNSFLGGYAGYNNTTGNFNNFMGYASGYYNTTGAQNIFVGYYAGYKNTTANNNLFLGMNSGYESTTGASNVFIGNSSGYGNTTGSHNTGLGVNAGYYTTTGNYNIFIGEGAGNNNTDGNYNLDVGNSAGAGNQTGDYNTLLGHGAGYSLTGSNNIMVGYRAGYNETGSNKLYISNSDASFPLLYGDFGGGTLSVGGLFAVGTKTPSYPMELKTTGRNATFVLQRTDGGALNFINATASYGQFGTGNNYPVRIQVNNAWKMQLNGDNSLSMASGATCTAGGAWTNSSSRELKENIEALTAEEALAALGGLAPVKYNYKVDKGERHVGFIAEDVPDLVASPDRKTLSPMDVVAVLAKALQEQQKKIAALENRLAEFEKKRK